MNNKIYQDYSINSARYQTKIKNLLFFETISFYGRTFLSNPPKLNTNNQNYLHLGCGINKLEGWINADFFSGLKPWKKDNNKPDWMLDLRFPLKCVDNIWDGVFTEHTLEHLYPNQTLALLNELHRTMKRGAWIRITVPDVEKYVEYYQHKEGHQKFYIWQTGCEAIHAITQKWGHKSVWDSKLLERFLQEAGFVNIKKVSFRQGTDKLLLQARQERMRETLYMEAQKP